MEGMQSELSPPILLGIEAGGTHTVALCTTLDGQCLGRAEFGPGNLRLLSDCQLSELFQAIAIFCPQPGALGLGMAGLRDEQDAQRLRRLLSAIWPNIPLNLAHDLETALQADAPTKKIARSVVVSGTGSCCYGRSVEGRTTKLGGWGHILGDKGSGYEIGLRALKAVVYYFDRDGEWSRLGQAILRELLLNRPDDLIPWVQTATKDQIAALAQLVFEEAAGRDAIARDILQGAAATLAKDALACVRRIANKFEPVEIALRGSVFNKQPTFAKKVGSLIRSQHPKIRVIREKREGAWGAIQLARAVLSTSDRVEKNVIHPSRTSTPAPQASTPLSLTEERNPQSLHLDRLSVEDSISLFLKEDASLPHAIAAETSNIAHVVRLTTRALKNGGRLFYFGAGSSGRLGVLDASECPPTFRTHPEQVQGIIAGGFEALWKAKEGAEDNSMAGAEAVRFRGVQRGDVVIGIAASGTTPFVWGALTEAKARHAKTVLLCFNPRLKIHDRTIDVMIAPAVGPEILTGSTRLKAGTATKLILNIITTLTMVRLGKVVSNLMVDLKPSNDKLRDRAVRIVQELAHCDSAAARAALEKNEWTIKKSLRLLPKGRKPK